MHKARGAEAPANAAEADAAPVIAIDGPGGVGKTTVSRLIAERLGLRYIDTGAMYRAIALAASDNGVDIDSPTELQEFCSRAEFDYDASTGRVSVNGRDYTDELRTERAGELASRTSAKAPVREFLTRYQRSLAQKGGVVMEGRDIGTVVLPGADAKFFLDAPTEVRARRRHRELDERTTAGLPDVSRESVRAGLEKRDARDTARANAPLKKAADAVYVDTSLLDIEGVVGKILEEIKGKTGFGDIHN